MPSLELLLAHCVVCDKQCCLLSCLWTTMALWWISSASLASQLQLFSWQLSRRNLLNPNPTDSDIQTGRPNRILSFSLCLRLYSDVKSSLLFSSRSVYWLDQIPPESTGSITKIGTSFSSLSNIFFYLQHALNCFFVMCAYMFFFLELTPRWSELCRNKTFYSQVT